MHTFARAMRDAEQDPKKPHPLSIRRKGDNAAESREYGPRQVRPGSKQRDRDRHTHVSC
jgi:hypothetical protein